MITRKYLPYAFQKLFTLVQNMQIFVNSTPLHEEIFNAFLERYVGNKEDMKVFFKKFAETIRIREDKMSRRWEIFDDFYFYLALRVVLGHDFVIYPSRKMSEEKVTQILKINEITFCSMEGKKGVVKVDNDTIEVLNVGSISKENVKNKLTALKPLRFAKTGKYSNHDERCEEILFGFDGDNIKDNNSDIQLGKMEQVDLKKSEEKKKVHLTKQKSRRVTLLNKKQNVFDISTE